MLKLWIVHRSPQRRASLVRLAGLPAAEVAAGAPSDEDFAEAETPAAIALALDGDFERELEFAHRHRTTLASARWLLLCAAEDADEARRLFASVDPAVLPEPPSARALRAFVESAVVRRHAASLAERRQRARIAERFSAWLGGVEVPGLLRALDPSLARLPLLVRGRPGSGRSLLCHYVELYRHSRGRVLRLHGGDLADADAIVTRLGQAERDPGPPVESVWIDDVDRLPSSGQETLAEWIVHGLSSAEVPAAALRWIATASASADDLEPALEQAFAPLLIDVPALSDHPETLTPFVEEVCRDWARDVGGPLRRFADGALLQLQAHPWSGDRAELEAAVRTTLAASSRELIEADDLRFPSDPTPLYPAPETDTDRGVGEPVDAIHALISPPEAEEDLDDAVFEEASPMGPISDLLSEVGAPRPGAALDDRGAEHGNAIEAEEDESTRLAEASLELASQPLAPEATAEAEVVGEFERHQGWRRLARSLSHEIRNPLVSIRTFTELLPEHFDDETFRHRFTELVGKDVAHISDVLSRLSTIAERDVTDTGSVDVSDLLESLLEERRDRITRGRLLVLRELERDAPLATVDAEALRVALAGLLDRALESLPERGDLFVATRRLDRGADGHPRLRILLRHHNPARHAGAEAGLEEFEPIANVLEYVLAEAVVEASGGSLTIDATDAGETLILVDLRAPR